MLRKLKLKSEFTRNVLTLMTGTTISQAIPIAISPILTRLYTPENYGVLALFLSISSLFAVFSTGKYELAIMLPKKDEDAMYIVVLSIFVSIVMFFISFFIVYVFNDQITFFFSNKDISLWLYLIPLSLLLTGLYQSLIYWMNRKKNYKTIAMNQVVRTTVGSSGNLIFGFFGVGVGGLILGGVIGQLISTYTLSRESRIHRLLDFSRYKKIKFLALIKKYKKMPLITLPNSLVDKFRLSGIVMLIGKYFGVAILGQFSLAWRMVQVPMLLMGSSLSQVLFQKISNSKKDELYEIVMKFIIKICIFSIPVFLGIHIFAVDIFKFIFGEEWELAGKIASTLSLWLFFNFITTPLSTLFIRLDKQEVIFLFSLIYMFTPLIILYFYFEDDFISVITMITYAMSFLLFFLIIYVVILLKKFQKEKEDEFRGNI